MDEGVIFEFTELVPFITKYKANPVTGAPASSKNIIRLNMVIFTIILQLKNQLVLPRSTTCTIATTSTITSNFPSYMSPLQSKNSDGLWHCPVTCKVFNNKSHVVAIKTTGNVFSYQAVQELNIRTKNYEDLLTGESFIRADILTLQDPSNEEHMSLRDVHNFKHLRTLQLESDVARESESKVRQTPGMDGIMREIEKKRKEDEESGVSRKMYTINQQHVPTGTEIEDIAPFWDLQPTVADINPGSAITEHKASCALTSSASEIVTKSSIRLANPDEIRDARWKTLRALGKKAYAQVQTNFGNINLELHCNIAPRTCWNFITLVERGYYDGVSFHRLIPGFGR